MGLISCTLLLPLRLAQGLCALGVLASGSIYTQFSSGSTNGAGPLALFTAALSVASLPYLAFSPISSSPRLAAVGLGLESVLAALWLASAVVTAVDMQGVYCSSLDGSQGVRKMCGGLLAGRIAAAIAAVMAVGWTATAAVAVRAVIKTRRKREMVERKSVAPGSTASTGGSVSPYAGFKFDDGSSMGDKPWSLEDGRGGLKKPEVVTGLPVRQV